MFRSPTPTHVNATTQQEKARERKFLNKTEQIYWLQTCSIPPARRIAGTHYAQYFMRNSVILR